MDADDASPAEMRRPPTDFDADPLALDEDTVERLLTGALPPHRAPAGYAKVAQLLAAAAAAPTPEELAGPGAALAELRAMARARSAATFAAARARPPRRRRRGLAVAIVVGALATGGVAGAATGHLPGPVRDAAQAITGAGIGTPASPATGQPSTSATGTPNAGAAASRPGGAPGSGPGSTGAGVAADPATDPGLKGLCLAYVAGEGADRGGKLDATKFAELVRAAGGEEQVPAYCEELLPGDQQLEESKKTKESEQPDAPGPGQQDPPAGTGSLGGPTASTGSGQSQGASPSESGRP